MIAKLEKINGTRMIIIDGKSYLPVAYRSFRPMPSNINQFYRSGVRLFQIQVTGRKNTMGVNYSNYGGVWIGDHKYDFSPFDRQMDMLKRFAPEGKVMVMLQLDAPEWWLEAHPYSPDGYECIGEAYFDDEWRNDVTEYITEFLKYSEENYGDDIFAYSFSGGIATEWFDKLQYYHPSEKKIKAYKAYSGNMDVPTEEEMSDVSGICIREPKSKEVTFRNFCCTLTPDLINHFAKLFKEKTSYRKIIGLFFGYTDCPNPEFQIRSSIVGYEEAWKSSDIDMLFSPASYSYFDDKSREFGGASSYQYLVDSVEINDKLYLHEIDHRTHLAGFPLENGVIVESYPDLFTTTEILRRELCATLCKGGSLWWFDFYGNYYACPELEGEISKQIKIIEELSLLERERVSEIAVFADPLSFNLLKENLNLTVDFVRKNRNNLHMCGAPFDYFNLSDITKIDIDKYKMFVFLYAPRMSSEVKTVIRNIKEKTKVFIHLPDVASEDKLNFGNIEKNTKMHIHIETESKTAVYKNKKFGFSKDVSPVFYINDEQAEIIAKFENGDGAAGIKGDNVYISVPDVPSELWHEIALRSGVHMYTDENVPIYADSRFVSCQFPGDCNDIIRVKQNGVYREAFSGKLYDVSNNILEFDHYNYQMMLFIKE